MTVDSEAIFALMEAARRDHAALEELRGTMATAWLDERDAATVCTSPAASGGPLWIGRARRELFFASTKSALEVVEGALRLTLRKHEVAEGRLLHLERRPDRGRDAVSARPLAIATTRRCPPVRAPHEGVSCLAKLAAR